MIFQSKRIALDAKSSREGGKKPSADFAKLNTGNTENQMDRKIGKVSNLLLSSGIIGLETIKFHRSFLCQHRTFLLARLCDLPDHTFTRQNCQIRQVADYPLPQTYKLSKLISCGVGCELGGIVFDDTP